MSLDPSVFNEWLHSHEEDSDEVAVYRPRGHPFPPARGRGGFEIREDGRFVELAIAATDGTTERRGRWSERDDGRLDVRIPNGTSYVMDVVEVEEDALKVRKR